MKSPSASSALSSNFLPALAILALAGGAQAQLTWDPDITAGVTPGGSGTWDTSTGNWSSGAANQAWDNTGATTAIIPDVVGNQIISVVTGVVVGDLNYADDQILQFRGTGADADNTVLALKSGGATWNTGGGQIEFRNNQALDISLSMFSGNTLTINGGGEFDTGEKPTGATWAVGGATLDITEPSILRGQGDSVGQFALVKIAAGSTFIQERNADQTLSNNWELTGTGTVIVGNRWGGRSVLLNGEVSGTGGLTFRGLNSNLNGASGIGRLNNTANSFTGGIVVDGSVNSTLLRVAGADDAVLGAVPAALDPANITLKDGGKLRFDGAFSVNANRGVTLDNGGVIILSGSPSSLAGPITGTGGLTIGVAEDGSSNTLILSNNTSDYQGGTNIVRGSITAGVVNSLPTDSVLSLLANTGGTTGFFDFNGFDTMVGGLVTTAGAGTRELRNGGAEATLTINVATGEDYSFFGNLNTTNTVNIVKDGPGTQTLGRPVGYANDPGTITVNDGELIWNVSDSWGDTTVNDGGSFSLSRTGTAASFTAASGSTTVFDVAITDWTGTEGTDWPKLDVTGDLDIAAGSTFTVKVTDGATNFTEANKSFTIASVGGTVVSVAGAITVDQSGFTAGTGTWSIGISGQDLVLNYNSNADPYADWAATFAGLTDTTFGLDFDKGGLATGVEYVVGGDPSLASDDAGLAPTFADIGSELVFTFRRSDLANDDANTTIIVQYGSDLTGWNTAENGTDGVVITENDNFYSVTPGVDQVIVSLPHALGMGGKLFARLKVEQP